MQRRGFFFPLLCLILLGTTGLRADTLVFTNGDQINGTLVRADASSCVFQSDMAGTVTVAWNKIQQLRTTNPYVVVGKDGKMHQGQLLVDGAIIEITSDTAPQPAFVAPQDLRMVVDPATYAHAVAAHPALWRSWVGQVSGGFSQVSATQSADNYTAAIELHRPVPSLTWLPQQSNTLFHFEGTYGQLTQPGVAGVKTSIFSTGLEQDQDLNARFFVFANAQFDHNIAQSLQLQQAYGGGIGWKLMNSAKTQLALRADLHWTDQHFITVVGVTPATGPGEGFLASSFTETLRQVYGKVIWTQNLSVAPSYTYGAAYQMSGLSAWALPVYHSLSVNFTVAESYLNNPQPGYLKNSLQISTGLQWALK